MRAAAAVMVAVLAAAAALAACSGASAPMPTPPPGAVVITAERNLFVEQQIAAPAGAPFTLFFANRDSEPHNVRVLDSTNMTVAATEVFSGPAARTVDAVTLAPGAYRLLCDIHSEMTAQLVAE